MLADNAMYLGCFFYFEENYKDWLNDSFKDPVEVEVEDEYSDDEGYLINIKFI